MSVSQQRIVPLKTVCTLAGVARSSVYLRKAQVLALRPPARRGPRGAASDAELVTRIRAVLAASPFVGEGYRKVWARLRHQGLRTSRARVLRLMRAHELLAPTRLGSPRGPQSHDGTIIPAAPDLRWGTDLTGTFTLEDGPVSVLLTVDHCSAEILGIHAAKRATRFEALEPVRQAVRRSFGRIAQNVAVGLELRHDHGSQYLSDDFQTELAFLGITSSPAFVRAPEGNGCAERAIRTLKEQLLWIRTFRTVEELRLALLEWAELYNSQWLIERHGFRPPAAVRRDHEATLQKRAA